MLDILDDTHLVFLRHGESEGNKSRIMQGRGDYPLSKRGRQQALEVRGEVQRWGASLFVASGLSRSYDTAVILSGADTVVRDERLCERDAGPWQGTSRDEMENMYPGSLEEERLQPQGFESTATVLTRVVDALLDASEHDGLVVVVGHGATLRLLGEHLTGVWHRYDNLEGMVLSKKLEWRGRINLLNATEGL